ncbi:hypothetical protein [Occallatibacter savannae]|uniref:hypothetical protein n=1 Tax=Occallatibacter savannae TaxID=1002691 RepID=UPI0013A56377|nr:hypothetical protein [Occallatibacter savannae]
MRLSVLSAFCIPAIFFSAGARSLSAVGQSVTIPAGVPLRVQINHPYRVHVGQRIEGHLIEKVDHVDHVVLPVNTPVSGVILGMRRVSEPSRTHAILDGQFMPPAVPAVRFDSLRLPDGRTVKIETAATERDATVVTMNAGSKPGLRARARAIIQDRKREAAQTLHHPNIGDRVEKWIYGQLPWSPPTVWTGTEYDAELTAPLMITGPQPPPLPEAPVQGTPTGIVHARLLTPLNSATDRKGTPVSAVLTSPLLTGDAKQVVFPEGATMSGVVTVDRPAKWFARNGQLRFLFHSISREDAASSSIHGQLASAETSPGSRVRLSDEGTAQSSSGPGKYLAPMALGVMAASAFDGDATSNPIHSGVDSNGFGFAARLLVMSSANAVLLRGFAVFAVSKSVYYRWIARGHEVAFPRDTRVQILLNAR